MTKKSKIQVVALLLFFLLALFQLYPLSLHPARGVHDPGDPLLNTWIFSHVQKSLLSQPTRLYDGNIFYPSDNTITYSELLLPQAIVSLPITLLTGNPLLAYNFLFLFSYILAAYAMFLLVRHLTGDSLSGIVAGVMFAFSTYHLDHTAHLQLLSSGLFVLSFYYLHRFFQEKRTAHSVLFAVFLLLQALACLYYGLFFISILVVVLPLFLLSYRTELDRPFLFKLILPLLAAVALVLLVLFPYIFLIKDLGFGRELTQGVDLTNYLGASRNNILYGKLLSSFGAAERYLFPGFVALLLTGFYIVTNRKIFRNIKRFLWIFFLSVISLCLVAVLIITIFGGWTINLGILEITGHTIAKPAIIILLAITGFILLSFIFFLFSNKRSQRKKEFSFYLYILVFLWALLLSFGKSFSIAGQTAEGLTLPFAWLHEYVPGFQGIRAPSRYGIFVFFALAVMAGYGFCALAKKIKEQRIIIAVTGLVVVLLNVEFMVLPHKMSFVPSRKEIPETYKWLAEKKEDFAVLEFPFFQRMGRESVYSFFSIFHQKKLVNGYSGFIPPYYHYIRELFDFFPSTQSVNVLKSLGVKYVIIHTGMMEGSEAKIKLKRIHKEFENDLKYVKSFENSWEKPWEFSNWFSFDIIYEIIQTSLSIEQKQQFDWTEIPVSDWTISSSMNEHLLHNLRDGKLETRWTTGIQKRPGYNIILEFDKPMNHSRLTLNLGSSINDFGVNFLTEVSSDGKEWISVNGAYSPHEFLEHMLDFPGNPKQKIYIHAENIKYVKITQLGSSEKFWWSIAELEVSTHTERP